MGDENGNVGLSAQLVGEHADEIAAACAATLSNVLGSEINASSRHVDAVDASCAVECDGPVLHALCRGGTEGAQFGLHVIAAREEAAVLAGLQLGQDVAEIEEATKQELPGDLRAAFQGVAKSILSSVATTLGDALAGDVSVQDAREVADPSADPTWLDAGHFVRIQLGLECELIEDGLLSVLLPGDGSSTSGGTSLSLIFLENCPEEFERLEVLGNELSCDLSVEQPHLFLAELDEELADTVVVVPWDLGGRSGLELVETLRADARFAATQIVMSAVAPKRGQVGAALRAGAVSFLGRPYQREEIEIRLLGGATPPAVEASSGDIAEKMDPGPEGGDGEAATDG